MRSEDAVDSPGAPDQRRPGGITLDQSAPPASTGIIACKITRLIADRPTSGDEALGVMNLTGSGQCYTIASKFLADHDANIERTDGTTDEKAGIVCSSFTFKAPNANITRMIQEIEMNRIDDIPISPTAPTLSKTYEVQMTVQDRKHIFHPIASILETYGRIKTQRCKASGPFRLDGSGETIQLAQIYIKFELPIDKIGHLGKIMDQIRALGGDEYWDVEDPREIAPRAALSDMLAQLQDQGS